MGEDNEKENSKKYIKDLLSFQFLVESYQRGYKWDRVQVEDLLNDIDKETESDYCLQPLVVKEVKDNQNTYELIDGQQRITTIYMILKFLGNTEPKKECFSILYETRKGSTNFLNNINQIQENDNWDSYKLKTVDNIDNYHFFTAYQTIVKWFNSEDKKNIKKDFETKLLGNVYVLWYDVSKEKNNDSRDVFSRLNSGKIQLTNAELIKALFLSNVNNSNEEFKNIKQNEIALEWDRIEYTLQKDSFWYFLSKETPPSNRIDLIFNLKAEEINENRKKKIDQELFKGLSKKRSVLESYYKINLENKIYCLTKELDEESCKFLISEGYLIEKKNNNYFAFKVFEEYLKNKNDLNDVWKEIKKYFMRFEEWYEDIELYNLIGYIIHYKLKPIEKLKEISESNNKVKFKKELKDIITNDFLEKAKKEIDNKKIDLEAFEYNTSNAIIHKILMLFNISELSNNLRFSFKEFKGEEWSLEHIHPQNALALNGKEKIIAYLEKFGEYFNKLKEPENAKEENNIKYIDECKLVICKIDNLIKDSKNNKDNIESFETLKSKYQELFNEIKANENFSELFNLHGIANLALLSKNINSSLNNGFFDEKRAKIIEFDNKGEFIPIATRNVFFKYYSPDDTDLYFWSNKNREHYIDKIKNNLNVYLNSNIFIAGN